MTLLLLRFPSLLGAYLLFPVRARLRSFFASKLGLLARAGRCFLQASMYLFIGVGPPSACYLSGSAAQEAVNALIEKTKKSQCPGSRQCPDRKRIPVVPFLCGGVMVSARSANGLR